MISLIRDQFSVWLPVAYNSLSSSCTRSWAWAQPAASSPVSGVCVPEVTLSGTDNLASFSVNSVPEGEARNQYGSSA